MSDFLTYQNLVAITSHFRLIEVMYIIYVYAAHLERCVVESTLSREMEKATIFIIISRHSVKIVQEAQQRGQSITMQKRCATKSKSKC
eukprot:scaffold3619_cov97-Skeletonema_marinoi.AAC.7